MASPPDPPGIILPFGRHKGRPPAEVPTSYLNWLIRTVKLSSGLRAAVAAELQSRGSSVPPAPAPAPPRDCRTCPGAEILCLWGEARNGRRFIWGECSRCRRSVGHLPLVPPYTTRADAAASKAPVIEALTRAEDLGVELESDGSSVRFVGDGWEQAGPDLRATVRQCNNQLARLLGRTAARPAN